MQTVLVTGASRGLGLEFVRQLVRRDPAPKYVFASCRAPDRAQGLNELAAAHSNVKVLEIDVQNEATYGPAVEKVASLCGETGLNVLINNAGIASKDAHETVSRELLTSVLDINVISPMRLTQAFLPLLRKGAQNSPVKDFSFERGAVVNISSGLGSISTTSGGYAGYRESKAALNMFTANLSIALKPDKILAVSQCPGWVATDMGGPNASRTPESSISDMLQIFAKLTEEHNGCFMRNSVELQLIEY